MFRWRDRHYFGPRHWLETTLRDTWFERDPEGIKKKGKVAGQASNPLRLFDELEFWPDKGGNGIGPRFTHIATIYSELLSALSTTGQILSWKWSDPEPYRHIDYPHVHHPRALPLGIHTEKVVLLSASVIRCSVVTESRKVASWVDETVTHVPGIKRLESTAQHFPEFRGVKIISLHEDVRLENGTIYWWRFLPPGQRLKLWDKYRAKAKKSQTRTDIFTGAQVQIFLFPLILYGIHI